MAEDKVIDIGPYICEEATNRGIDPEAMADHMLYKLTQLTIVHKGSQERVTWMPGHVVNHENDMYGPPEEPVEVLVVGKMPLKCDLIEGELMSGPNGEVLSTACKDIGLDYSGWYLTNVCRFAPPGTQKTVPVGWVKECAWMLEREIELTKPKHILVLGGVAVKALFGNKSTLTKYRGVEGLDYKGIPTFVTTHPAAVSAEPKKREGFKRDLQQFQTMITGKKVEIHPVKYEVIENIERLTQVVDSLMGVPRLAVDCEWGGENGGEYAQGGKLRYVQFAAEPYTGFTVLLRREGLVENFKPNLEAAYTQLRRLFCQPGLRLGGHAMTSDMKYVIGEIGADCRQQVADGLDTMLAYHLVYPHEDGFGLEKLSVRYTDLGRYDKAVDQWIDDNTKKNSRKAYLRKHGYAYVPDELLLPYSMCDVDVVMRVWDTLENLLRALPMDKPYVMPGVFAGQRVDTLWDLFRYILQPSNLPFNEIETCGTNSDPERLMDLVLLFKTKLDTLELDFQQSVNWADLNIRSPQQMQELLFGWVQATKEPAKPKDAYSFKDVPVMTTEKPARDWHKVKAAEVHKKTVAPHTGIESLQILYAQTADPRKKTLYTKLLRLKFINQVVKQFLQPPEVDAENKKEVWVKGLVAEVDPDRHIRTHLIQLTDTGRPSSSSPNLLNLPKKRESETRLAFAVDLELMKATKGWSGMTVDELKASNLIDPRYFTIRSCFTASPGHVLIESDYRQAELFVLAYLARDVNMMALMDDPSRDMHSEMAVNAFNLQCAYEEVKKLHPDIRVAAKAANFRIPYGGGAAALSRQVKAEAGVELPVADARNIIATFFKMYPSTAVFFDECHAAVEDPGYVSNAFGRRRWFPHTEDSGVRAKQKREAGNMPIQGTVADAILIALYNLYMFRNANNMRFKIGLTIYDAVILDVPCDEAEYVRDVVLPACMVAGATIPTIGLTLSIDTDIMRRWGVKVDEQQAIEEARLELAV